MILQGELPPEAKNWAFEPVKLRGSPPQAKFSDFRSPKWAICKGNLPKTDPIFTGFRFEGIKIICTSSNMMLTAGDHFEISSGDPKTLNYSH